MLMITVTIENPTNTTNSGSKITAAGDARLTRSSTKAPWEMLQESICGINSTTATSPSKKRKRSNSKKKKNKIINLSTQSIDNLFLDNSTLNLKTTGVSSSETVVPKTTLPKADYFKSTEARILFKPTDKESFFIRRLVATK